MTWCAELAVLPRTGNLAEHELVDIALGVAVFHRNVIEHVHHLSQQARRGDGEPGVLHVVGVGGPITGLVQSCSQKGKHVLADHGEHLGRREVL